MHLDSYTCDMCILQRLETCAHLLLPYNFAEACWTSIGITVAMTTYMPQIFNCISPFVMEIVIHMAWSIWTARNYWIFSNINPSVERCKGKFIYEFSLLRLRVKSSSFQAMELWLNSLYVILFFFFLTLFSLPSFFF